MHKLQCFSKYDLHDLYNSSGFNYLQVRFTQIAPPHKAPLSFIVQSTLFFYKCVLNNGMQYHNIKMLGYHSSMNYNISKPEQYTSYINNHLLVVQNK